MSFLCAPGESRRTVNQAKKKAPTGAFLVLTALYFYLAAISSRFIDLLNWPFSVFIFGVSAAAH